jgi:hypothetical protein
MGGLDKLRQMGRQGWRRIAQIQLCLWYNNILGFSEGFLELFLGNFGNQSWIGISG